MLKNKCLRYILFIFFICCFIFAGKFLFDRARDQFNEKFRIAVVWVFITPIILHIGFGVLLGLNHLLKEKAKVGKWRVNLSKLIIIGIPALIFGHLQ